MTNTRSIKITMTPTNNIETHLCRVFHFRQTDRMRRLISIDYRDHYMIIPSHIACVLTPNSDSGAVSILTFPSDSNLCAKPVYALSCTATRHNDSMSHICGEGVGVSTFDTVCSDWVREMIVSRRRGTKDLPCL